VDYDPGTTLKSHARWVESAIEKLEQEYDPTDKIEAVQRLMKSHAKGEVLTGVFYINAKRRALSTC